MQLYIKFIILGDSSVGKTNILSQYAKNEFNQNMISTIGVEFYTKKITIKNTNYNIQIWDTAGQEKFRSIVKSIYHSINAAILVYDITNIESFYHVNYWLNDIRNNSNDELPICLVGNKTDLEYNRVISYQQGLELANKNNLFFIETSALKNTNIGLIFDNLMTKIIKFENIKKTHIQKYITINNNNNNNIDNNINKCMC